MKRRAIQTFLINMTSNLNLSICEEYCVTVPMSSSSGANHSNANSHTCKMRKDKMTVSSIRSRDQAANPQFRGMRSYEWVSVIECRGRCSVDMPREHQHFFCTVCLWMSLWSECVLWSLMGDSYQLEFCVFKICAVLKWAAYIDIYLKIIFLKLAVRNAVYLKGKGPDEEAKCRVVKVSHKFVL